MKKTSLSRKITIAIIITAIALMALVLLNSCSKTNDSINNIDDNLYGSLTITNKLPYLNIDSIYKIKFKDNISHVVKSMETKKFYILEGDNQSNIKVGINIFNYNNSTFDTRIIETIINNGKVISKDTAGFAPYIASLIDGFKYFKYNSKDKIEIKLESIK